MTDLITLLLAATVSIASCAPFSGGADTTATGSMLEGKTIAFAGDSIGYGTNWLGGYAKIIGEDEGMIVTNTAKGGASVARGVKWSADSEGYRPCIIDMVESMESEFDYIIVEGGINDFWNHTPMGELTDGFDGGYDAETFAGAMETVFYDIKTLHPESKAGFVIVHDPFTYNAEADFEKYYEAIKASCEKWDVPYLDLYAANNQETGVNVRDAEQKKLYFGSDSAPEGDGTHPNEQGYRTIYAEPMIEWLKTL